MLGNRKAHSKTAVSVIIGALILVVIAVGVAVAAYAYASSATANLGSTANNLIGNSGNALAEQVNIAYASFNLTASGSSQAGVALSVQNFGVNPISISSVYIQNDVTGSLAANLLLSTPISVQPGAFQAIAIDFTPMNAVPYKITVVTLLGTQASTVAIG